MKLCPDCAQTLPLDEFFAAPKRRDGRATYCKPCHSIRNRRWGRENQERLKESRTEANRRFKERHPDYRPPSSRYSRANRLWREYRLTEEDWDAMYEAQDGRCGSCGQAPQNLVVDHDHATGQIRSLLCHNCNTAEGMLKSDPRRIQALLDYVLLHNNRSAPA